MSFISKIFQNRRIKPQFVCSSKPERRDSKHVFKEEDVRIVVFRNSSLNGHSKIYDSHDAAEQQAPADKASKDGKVDPKQTSKQKPYKRQLSNSKMLGEMVFGSDILAHKGSTFKVHSIRDPPELMMTKVFTASHSKQQDSDASRRNSLFSSNSSLYSNEENSPENNLCSSLTQSLPIPRRQIDEEFAHSFESSYSGNLSLGPVRTPSSSPGTEHLFALKRWQRSYCTSFEYNLSSQEDGSRSLPSQLPPINRRPHRFGLCVLFTLENRDNTKQIPFEDFLFAHITIIEGHLNRLQNAVITNIQTTNSKAQFVTNMKKAAQEFCNMIGDLYSAPRLENPVWLQMMSSPTEKMDMTLVYMKHLMMCWDKYEEKGASNHFLSSLLTVVLTNHLAWVSTVAPTNSCQSKDYLDKHTANWLDTLAKTHPYNPLWAQMGDLYGAIGNSRLSRTIITGTKQGIVYHMLYFLSYFLRCSQLHQIKSKALTVNYDQFTGKDFRRNTGRKRTESGACCVRCGVKLIESEKPVEQEEDNDKAVCESLENKDDDDASVFEDQPGATDHVTFADHMTFTDHVTFADHVQYLNDTEEEMINRPINEFQLNLSDSHSEDESPGVIFGETGIRYCAAKNSSSSLSIRNNKEICVDDQLDPDLTFSFDFNQLNRLQETLPVSPNLEQENSQNRDSGYGFERESSGHTFCGSHKESSLSPIISYGSQEDNTDLSSGVTTEGVVESNGNVAEDTNMSLDMDKGERNNSDKGEGNCMERSEMDPSDKDDINSLDQGEVNSLNNGETILSDKCEANSVDFSEKQENQSTLSSECLNTCPTAQGLSRVTLRKNLYPNLDDVKNIEGALDLEHSPCLLLALPNENIPSLFSDDPSHRDRSIASIYPNVEGLDIESMPPENGPKELLVKIPSSPVKKNNEDQQIVVKEKERTSNNIEKVKKLDSQTERSDAKQDVQEAINEKERTSDKIEQVKELESQRKMTCAKQDVQITVENIERTSDKIEAVEELGSPTERTGPKDDRVKCEDTPTNEDVTRNSDDCFSVTKTIDCDESSEVDDKVQLSPLSPQENVRREVIRPVGRSEVIMRSEQNSLSTHFHERSGSKPMDKTDSGIFVDDVSLQRERLNSDGCPSTTDESCLFNFGSDLDTLSESPSLAEAESEIGKRTEQVSKMKVPFLRSISQMSNTSILNFLDDTPLPDVTGDNSLEAFVSGAELPNDDELTQATEAWLKSTTAALTPKLEDSHSCDTLPPGSVESDKVSLSTVVTDQTLKTKLCEECLQDEIEAARSVSPSLLSPLGLQLCQDGFMQEDNSTAAELQAGLSLETGEAFEKIPMPLSPVSLNSSQNEEILQKELNLGYSLLGGFSRHYLSDFVLHGTCEMDLHNRLHKDLSNSLNNSLLDEPIQEASCVVADTDKWTVKEFICRSQETDRLVSKVVEPSRLVQDALQSTHQLHRLKMSPEFCLMHLEDKLQEIYFKSRLLQEYNSSSCIDLTSIPSVLGIDTSDLDLVQAISQLIAGYSKTT